MSHVMFGGLTHEPAVRLATRLVEITPEPLRARLPRRLGLGVGRGRGQDVPAVLALARAARRKQRLLTWRGGYHGDTWQPMSVCDPEGGMHELWSGCCRARSSRTRRRPGSTRVVRAYAAAARADRAARRRAGRGDRGAGGAGRGRDAVPLPRVSAGAARGVRRARRAAGVRRDRDRLRPHGRAVRGGARRGHART